MPTDKPKHPSRYPIWMKQAIQTAMDEVDEWHFAVTADSEAHLTSLRRNFRAFVKAIYADPIWAGDDYADAVPGTTFRIRRVQTEAGLSLEIRSFPRFTQAEVERAEVKEQLRGSNLEWIFGSEPEAPIPKRK